MSRISRQFLIGALTVIFLSSACGRLTLASPTPVWTVPPSGQPVFPTATIIPPVTTTATLATTPQIPITGENVVSLQCEFCVDAESHAMLTFPDFAYFDVSSDTPVSCLTADVTGGKRILICHGTQSTTFNLNICSDPTNCLQFPVALQPCPLLQAGATPLVTGTPFTPVYLTPITTLKPTGKKSPTPTAGTAIPTDTAGTPTPDSVPATSTPPVDPPTSPTSYSGIPWSMLENEMKAVMPVMSSVTGCGQGCP
jgi:hypothetical protein